MTPPDKELSEGQVREEIDYNTTSTIYKHELKEYKESLKARYDYENDEVMKTHFEIAESLLENANVALETNDELTFLRYFYAALRRQYPILAKLDSLDVSNRGDAELRTDQMTANGGTLTTKSSPTRLQAAADRLWAQIDGLEQPDVREKIRNMIRTPEDQRKQDVNLYVLDNASRLLHDEYIMNYESITVLERILRKLNRLLVFLLVSLLVLVAILELNYDLNVPIEGFPLEGISRTESVAKVDGFLLYVYVVFVGIFGAVISNLLKYYDMSAHTGPRMPDEEFQIVDEVIYARILIGGTAAAFLYTVLLSGLLLPNQLQLSALFVMAVAFTAGFSDRLLVKALNSIEGNVLIT
ncbi:hypothetical protein [Haladaptatus sp. NG-SE-30]